MSKSIDFGGDRRGPGRHGLRGEVELDRQLAHRLQIKSCPTASSAPTTRCRPRGQGVVTIDSLDVPTIINLASPVVRELASAFDKSWEAKDASTDVGTSFLAT